MSEEPTLTARPPQSTEAAQVIVDSVTHRYADADNVGVTALAEVSFSVARGSFVSVIGPSGCGKSTLLHIIGGLMAPTSGTCQIAGQVVKKPPQDTGYMFQSATLLAWRTVIENIVLPIEIRQGRAQAKVARSRARELLKATGLEDFENSYPRELSGGMAQRAAICRMLVSDPGVLLLDEPFGALDEITRESMNEELQRVCLTTGATALMVTHSIPEAVFLSDQIVVMSSRPGRITEIIEIDLPRPRTFAATTIDPRFSDYVNQVRSALRPAHSGERPDGQKAGG
jgi:NitT/TauT family transport system ATP-binding protein